MADKFDIEKAGANTPAFSYKGDPFAPRHDTPILSLTLWPNRSLSRQGFRTFLWIIACGLFIPIFPFLLSPIIWGLLPFVLGTLVLVWWLINRNYRDGHLREELRIWADLITIEQIAPNGSRKQWAANPYWVKVQLQEDGKVDQYLTLKGSGREVELGAFLSPDERVALFAQVRDALRHAA